MWNVAVLAVGVGFFVQEQPIATYLHGIGWPVLIVCWAGLLLAAVVGVGHGRGPAVDPSN